MKKNRPKAVVIGSSAGALGALSAILPPLPADFPLPIMVVVHLPPDKDSAMAELLATKCKLNVCEAEDKQDIKAGTVYLAPPDYHLLVETDHSLSLSTEEPVLFSRPSIDVLFETALDAYDENLIGVILSGANNDGAEGLKNIARVGGLTIVQDPEEAYAPEMPRAALKACPSARILKLEEIASYLQKVATG